MHGDELVSDTDVCGMNICEDDTPEHRVSIKRRAQLRIRMRKQRRLIFCVIACVSLVVAAAFLTAVKLNKNGIFSRSRRSEYLRGSVPVYGAPFNENFVASKATHLIIVAGHSVLIGNGENALDESAWHLLDYQRGQGLPDAIVGHITAGISEAARDPQSLLVFSGGETRGDGTAPYSESSSYFRAADALNLWMNEGIDAGSNARSRTVTEEFATDSFENMIFSICRFKEVTGHYPTYITIVSFSFKEQRFVKLHASALKWPRSRLRYIGKDAPSSTGFDVEMAQLGEQVSFGGY